jgi:signal transduction histidine kinase
VELGNLTAALPPENARLREHGEKVRQLTEASVGVVRNMALLLRPSMLDDLGLVPALKWQAREVARRHGVKVRVAADAVDDELPDEQRTCVYRVVQEALQNVVRHARAASARVTLRQEADRLVVMVQDDGTGFDTAQEKGLGLLGMEERVKRLGGSVRIDSGPGGGTLVTAFLPLPKGGSEA